MAGTKAGGKKAAATNKEKYGSEFYANIGRKGGTISRRGPAKYPHLTKTDATVRSAAERRRLKAEIRALEAEEEW